VSGARDAVQSVLGKKPKVVAPKSVKKAVKSLQRKTKQARSRKRPTAAVTFKKRGKQSTVAKVETSMHNTRTKASAASVRKNVVHTLRGKNGQRGGAKSIRIVS
jgi:hypothetical protein